MPQDVLLTVGLVEKPQEVITITRETVVGVVLANFVSLLGFDASLFDRAGLNAFEQPYCLHFLTQRFDVVTLRVEMASHRSRIVSFDRIEMIADQVGNGIDRERGQLTDNLLFAFEFGFEVFRTLVPRLGVARRIGIEIKGDVD